MLLPMKILFRITATAPKHNINLKAPGSSVIIMSGQSHCRKYSSPLKSDREEISGRPRSARPALALTIKFMLITVGLLNGCGRSDPPAPPYNQMRSQIVEELFEALNEENLVQALNHLERLAGLTDTATSVETLRTHARNHRLMQQVNRLLAEGLLNDAREIAEEHVRNYGADIFNQKIIDSIGELRLIRQYLVNRSGADSSTLQTRLQELTERMDNIGQYIAVQEWLDQQRRHIAELRQQEIDARVRQIVSLVEVKIVDDQRDDIAGLMEELSELRPNHPLPAMRRRLRQEEPVGFPQPFLANLEMAPEQERQLIKLAMLVDWPAAAAREHNFADAVYEYIKETPPATTIDYILRIRLAARLDQPAAMLEYVRALINDGGSLDRATLDYVVRHKFLPPEQAMSRPWLTPFPTVTDLLNRLMQINEYRGTKAASEASKLFVD